MKNNKVKVNDCKCLCSLSVDHRVSTHGVSPDWENNFEWSKDSGIDYREANTFAKISRMLYTHKLDVVTQILTSEDFSRFYNDKLMTTIEDKTMEEIRSSLSFELGLMFMPLL